MADEIARLSAVGWRRSARQLPRAAGREPRALSHLFFTLLLLSLPPRAVGAQAGADPSFLLTTHAPDRSPPPLLGNGRIGGTVTANGTAPAPLLVTGLYEEARGDVPRIVAIPAPNTVDVFDGASWLNAAPPAALQRYTQTLDMRTAIVRTSYDWVDGERRTSFTVESFLSRADPYVTAIRVRIVPHYAGRVRVAFPLLGWPDPPRLELVSIAAGIETVLRCAGRKDVVVRWDARQLGASFRATWTT